MEHSPERWSVRIKHYDGPGEDPVVSVREAVALFRERLGYSCDSQPPAETPISLAMLVDLTESILGRRWSLVLTSKESLFTNTSVGIVRRNWQRVFGEPEGIAVTELPTRSVYDVELVEFLTSVISDSQDVERSVGLLQLQTEQQQVAESDHQARLHISDAAVATSGSGWAINGRRSKYLSIDDDTEKGYRWWAADPDFIDLDRAFTHNAEFDRALNEFDPNTDLDRDDLFHDSLHASPANVHSESTRAFRTIPTN